jgi:hypothetical protein
MAWILSVSQQNKGERLATFDRLKSHLLETRQWLLTQRKTKDREICLALVFELDKFDLSDLPQTNLGDIFQEYTDALEQGTDSDNERRRVFYLTSATYFSYIENLMSRIGLVSIRQIISGLFIDTLAKGVFVVSLAVITLITSYFWFGDLTKPWLVLLASFCGISTILLLIEIWIDMRRYYDEELDFIDRSNEEEEED